MQIEMPARAIKLLQEVLSSLDNAYEQHGEDNPHYAIYFDNPESVGQDPNEYESLNRAILKKAAELKRLIRM